MANKLGIEACLSEGERPRALEGIKSPFVVTENTYFLLRLLGKVAVNLEPARWYFDHYTVPYLQEAKEGRADVFSPSGPQIKAPFVTDNADFTTAAAHALIVMGSIPEVLSKLSRINSRFSRYGMFHAPETATDFLVRIQEIEAQIGRIKTKGVNLGRLNLTNYPLLRTYAFFKTAANLPIKSAPQTQEVVDTYQEAINRLLLSANISTAA